GLRGDWSFHLLPPCSGPCRCCRRFWLANGLPSDPVDLPGGSLSPGEPAEDLLHLGSVEGTDRLGGRIAQRPQVQQDGGDRLLVRGLTENHAVEGPQCPVHARDLDAHLLGCGLERSRPIAGVPDGLDALFGEVQSREEGCHGHSLSAVIAVPRRSFYPGGPAPASVADEREPACRSVRLLPTARTIAALDSRPKRFCTPRGSRTSLSKGAGESRARGRGVY